jgi:hypothetical protein
MSLYWHLCEQFSFIIMYTNIKNGNIYTANCSKNEYKGPFSLVLMADIVS